MRTLHVFTAALLVACVVYFWVVVVGALASVTGIKLALGVAAAGLGGIGVTLLAGAFTMTLLRLAIARRGWLEFEDDSLVIDYPTFLYEPIVVPRQAIRAAMVDPGFFASVVLRLPRPMKTRSLSARFPVEGSSAWLYRHRTDSPLPLIAPMGAAPNVALLFATPIDVGRVRRSIIFFEQLRQSGSSPGPAVPGPRPPRTHTRAEGLFLRVPERELTRTREALRQVRALSELAPEDTDRRYLVYPTKRHAGRWISIYAAVAFGAVAFLIAALKGEENAGSPLPTLPIPTQLPPVEQTRRPTIVVASPKPGARYLRRQRVRAVYRCIDFTGFAAETCNGTVPNGARINTALPGIHRFRVRAADVFGRRSLRVIRYSVR
jgi:hypothetical protein